MSKIQTYSGIMVDPLDMYPGDIKIQDIAHALSNQCRYSGHTSSHYSVASHSVFVAKELLEQRLGLFGLLHDASEAYLVDIPAPLKHSGLFEAYLDAEKRLQDKIYKKFCGKLPTESEKELIHLADIAVRKSEQNKLMVGWSYTDREVSRSFKFPHEDSKAAFLAAFMELI